jgi:monovalent cation/proton antiporter MnhG/PhaG subunit
MSVVQVIGVVVMVAGALLSAVAAWGMIDFTTPLSRMHAATKSASLGLSLLAVGAGVAAQSWGLVGVGVLVTLFMFVTSPIAGHLVGRAAYLAGQATTLVHDDLGSSHPQSFQVEQVSARGVSPTRWAALVAVWMLVWRDLSLGTLVGGGIVAAFLELLRSARPRSGPVSVSGWLRFLGSYVGLVVSSNLRVAWEVITPRNDQIQEAIVEVPLEVRSVSAALLVANSISYTPGSLTVELVDEPRMLYVHVLHFESVADVVEQVRRVESLVARALPPPAGA